MLELIAHKLVAVLGGLGSSFFPFKHVAQFGRYQLVLQLLILAGLSQYAVSQEPQRPVRIAQIEIQSTENLDLDLTTPAKQFRGQAWNATARTTIENSVREYCANSGYYFAITDSFSIVSDSSARTVDIFLSVDVGDVLEFARIEPEFVDTSQIVSGIDRIEEICAGYNGLIYTGERQQQLFADIVRHLENNGHPLARVSTGSFELRESELSSWLLDLGVDISTGDSVRINYLQFPGANSEIHQFLLRTLRFRENQLYSQEQIDRYTTILGRLDFIRRVDEPYLSLDPEGNFYVSFPIDESPATAFDGVIGYVPPPSTDPNASGYFTGLINIGVRNLFGGGRKAQIFWQKQDEFSDEFRLQYNEPFVAGMPFHARGGLYRLVRDTTFIEWQYNLETEVPFSDALSAFVELSTRSVIPDSLASRTLRLPRTSGLKTESGIRWDRRDHRTNPRKGVHFELAFSLSRQSIEGPDYLLTEDSLNAEETLRAGRMDLGIFLPLLTNQVLANHVHIEVIDNSAGFIRSPDQVWFGGAATIRGYRESQFFARRVGWINSEYRFILGPESRLFLFTDNGYYSRNYPDELEEWLTSYGIGMRFPAPLGVIQFDYGLEKGASFREGKIHFRLVNEF